MIHSYSEPIPHKITLTPKFGGKKKSFYSFDTVYLSFDDERYEVEIQNSKYDMPILQKQQRLSF